ncbi:MAG: hypothetical protein ABIN94_14155 [Ferruginibacter sp.]
MERKKWTPQTEITASLIKFREKRKWQLALRRYVLDRNPSVSYGFYFGLDITRFREWIEIQFTKKLNWENFGSAWQFGHVIPPGYFDFSKEGELKLCWNFVNIRIEDITLNANASGRTIDIVAIEPYFEQLYSTTQLSICLKMLEKVKSIQLSMVAEPAIEAFIIKNKEHVDILSFLEKDEFNRLNQGVTLENLLLEKEILKKFG